VSLRSRNRKLLRESSREWNAVLGILLVGIFALSLLVRLYALEPVRVVENSLEPRISAGRIVWICKLSLCTDKLSRGDIVLTEFPGSGPVLRAVFGLPGDSVEVFPDGKIQTGNADYFWEDESEILAPRDFYVPRKDDSIFLSDLNDISFDYASGFLRKEFGFNRYYVQTGLFRGKDSLPISRVGSAHLFGRPISTREIHGLHWQEYFLIALQINREEPGAKSVRFERRLFAISDSSEVTAFKSPESAYYLICLKGNRCEDSRNGGYVPKSQILGKVLHFQIPFSRSPQTN